MGICPSRKPELDLIGFLCQYQDEGQNKNIKQFMVITQNPQQLRQQYTINKNYLIKRGILSIDQLANNLNAQRQIMSEVEAEQFQLVYNYRQKQSKQSFSELPYGDNGYTFRFEYQNRLQQGKNVLVIGEQRSGKSTFINAIGNSLLIDYPDKYRYHISEYDFNGNIQECDLDYQNIQFKFLEVQGYGQNEQENYKILLQTYEHLKNNNIQIHCIFICRRFRNQDLNNQEKQIIFHLAELFGRQYIRKCFLVNTSYDLGNQIQDQLQKGLNKINNIYDQMPNPKILFINSITTPFEGNVGNHRFETVKNVRDSMNQLINNDNQTIQIISQDAFDQRRQIERTQNQIKNQIQIRLMELLPCLENYFQIEEVDENDQLLYANTVFWSILENGQRIKENKELKFILDEIILSENKISQIQPDVRQQSTQQLINSQTIDFDRQSRRLQENIYQEKYKQLRNNLRQEKTNRIQNIITLAEDYIATQNHYLEETYCLQQETIQLLIARYIKQNDQLRLFLQQDQLFEQEHLRTEFEQIRERLFLPNTNLLATEILGI
ncbi:unnamed protein product [Paramecium sonneborni]|uniref:Uncharacterized protein n=1 Tax=Paramecium sonneborni TaxID=65129 RepID=A0A8S1RGU7_9CILI|nr:unnamed protein product [Paramecium sonneborni]